MSLVDWYILDENNNPIKVDFYLEGALWKERNLDRSVVKQESFSVKGKEVKVSTIFHGIDQNKEDGPPLLFETKIIGGEEDQFKSQASTWDEAINMHELASARVKDMQ